MKEKKTEILLVQQEKETGIFECIQGLFLLLLYFYMSVFGCVFGFLSVFEIPCDHQMLAAALLIFGGFFFVLCLLGKRGRLPSFWRHSSMEFFCGVSLIFCVRAAMSLYRPSGRWLTDTGTVEMCRRGNWKFMEERGLSFWRR